jgi:translation initiation factor IF-3
MKKDKVREKANRQTVGKIKEIRFRPFIDTNDLKTKANKAKEFLDEGCNVKISVLLKGREMNHKDIVFEKLNSFISIINDLKLDDNFEAAMSSDPCINNRQITATISKKRISGEA